MYNGTLMKIRMGLEGMNGGGKLPRGRGISGVCTISLRLIWKPTIMWLLPATQNNIATEIPLSP